MADSLSDDPEFMNDPIGFIAKHPEMFNEDLQQMAAYQIKLSSNSLRLWGSLPEELDRGAEASGALRQKSQAAMELAQIILKADQQTLQTLASDATFEEKKALFDALAAVPSDDRGMRAIDNVVEQVIDWGPNGPQAQFGKDLEQLIYQVASTNKALQDVNAKYSTLFLAVRILSNLTQAAQAAKQK